MEVALVEVALVEDMEAAALVGAMEEVASEEAALVGAASVEAALEALVVEMVAFSLEMKK